MVPVAVLIGALARRRDISKARRLRHGLRFGIVLATRLVLDGHAQIVLGRIERWFRNLHPLLGGADFPGLRAGIGEMRVDGADLLFVATAANLHVYQNFVPGVVKLLAM